MFIDRKTEIEKENRRLLSKIADIIKNKNHSTHVSDARAHFIDNHNQSMITTSLPSLTNKSSSVQQQSNSNIKSLNIIKRRQEFYRIKHENQVSVRFLSLIIYNKLN